MKLELNDKEVAMLLGILGNTSGQGLIHVYSQLMIYATANNPDAKEIGDMMTKELHDLMRENNIDEDILYWHAIRQWNEKEGLI